MSPTWPRVTEALLTLVVLLAVGYLFFNHLDAYLCFMASCSEPCPDEVLRYRVTAAVVGLAVVGTWALAIRRRATWAYLWHVPVTLLAITAALVFAVPQIDMREALKPDPPEPSSSYVPCYSGPPHDCPGG